MCQIRAVVEKGGEQKTVMEAVTSLEVVDNGVVLSTFFEEPKKIADVVIQRIDFLGGAVVLKSSVGS
ncbi:MAG TPA: CooT family nickel-binding protein [Desulfobulbaceae bacterium]|nr:CooT family nickel-binding protein [Desulfobulbaceae bacterium]